MSRRDPIAKVMAGVDNRTWQGLLEPGTIVNLYNRPQTALSTGVDFKQPKGYRSTTYSATYTTKDDPRLRHLAKKYGDDTVILLPTVVNGKFLTEDEAVDKYVRTGQHLGIFQNLASSEPYAGKLHESQAAEGNFYGATSGQ